MRVSAFSVRSNANGRMRVSASVSKTVRSIGQINKEITLGEAEGKPVDGE
jgi:hypothetical protein